MQRPDNPNEPKSSETASRANFAQFEAEMLKIWDKEQTFQQSLKLRRGGKLFRFYDGPPFANGLPHYGHALASTEKDAITRYKTMRGYYVPRRAGWDTHGLPVEYEVEKTLGLAGKQQIMELGIEKFNAACRASVFKYKSEWEQFFHRFGRWIDTDNAYATLDDNYIESVWWVFAEIFKKGLVYQGFRSMPYCPRCATPLSNFELNQGYQDDVEDPSVYVLFPLVNEPSTALLAWTTTPWTLPANAALAVDPAAAYVEVVLQGGEHDGKHVILAEERLEAGVLGQEYARVRTMNGQDLVGKQYQPLYKMEASSVEGDKAWRVYGSKEVSLDDGTGILHIAPRYGEADLAIGLEEGLPLIESVDKFGRMAQQTGQFAGLFFKEADSKIIADLTARGRIFAAETFKHTYPFCWRCDSPLLYFATPSWFVRVSSLRDKLVKNNQEIAWVPAHIKDGRFGNWLAEARDWGISRNRFWGAPLPIWVTDDPADEPIVVSSIAELAELSGVKQFDMHRPGIDEVIIKRDGKTYRRVEEVFDCWFESGAMPYAEDHYPFENEQEFKDKYPADFIAEGLDQTRGWFYTLHVLATALFDQPAFRNVIVHGTVVAADGRKLSKRLKNYPEPQEIINQYGADSLRFFLLSSPALSGEDVRFSDDLVGDVYRNFFMTLYNVNSFLVTHAQTVDWQPDPEMRPPQVRHVLDRWILARLNQTVAEVTRSADRYELNRATRPLRDLVGDLSNWYLRRSRRRLSAKSLDGDDTQQAFAALHYVLVKTCQLLAPWAPFLSDKLYRELTDGMEVPGSVHLTDWPEAAAVDFDLLAQMEMARQAVTEGLAQRAAAGIRLRQPLAFARLETPFELPEGLISLMAEEMNVKQISWHHAEAVKVKLHTEINQELLYEGMARDVIRLVQDARKKAGLVAGDWIGLKLGSESAELTAAIEQHFELIKAETLASKLEVTEKEIADVSVGRVGGSNLQISLTKTS